MNRAGVNESAAGAGWTLYRKIGLLVVLYVIQAVPMGLSAAIPLILQSRGATYTEIAAYAVASLPFSLKLLWAPIVDALRFSPFGRRKTWLIPTQLLCGALMYGMAMLGKPSDWAGEKGYAKMAIFPLTMFFFALYILMATQDIAVDGWALEILPPNMRKHASTCNTIGQSLGFYVTNVSFLLLNNNLKSSYFVPLNRFLLFWSIVIFSVTIWIVLFEREEKKEEEKCPWQRQVMDSYLNLVTMAKLKPVILSCALLMTCRCAFGVNEILSLKLIESGVGTSQIALMQPLVAPWGIVASFICGGFICPKRPALFSFKVGYVFRLMMLPLWIVLNLYVKQIMVTRSDGMLDKWSWILVYTFSCLQTMATEFMFVSQMAFYAQVADARYGGTYMTFLNTIGNLGNKWPAIVALASMEPAKLGGLVDGYATISTASLILGIIWLTFFGNWVLRYLQYLPEEAWFVGFKGDTAQAKMSGCELTDDETTLFKRL